tara:strand:- start:436 stop:858 length:423 start_codon:yes stop_codon:yes gene_type:complete
MATLKTNTLTGTSTAGSIAVTGESGSTTTNLQQGLVKCWVNFDGTATDAAARDTFNVSAMTDNGTGNYTVTINNDMANTNYSGSYYTNATGTGTGSANFNNHYAGGFGDFATGSFGTKAFNDSANVDATLNYCGIFGDLA